LESLWPEAREPILIWSPGQPLVLPPPGHPATLVLHDVSELTHVEQRRVLAWLDQADGRIRVISTTAVPLWPRVSTGAFNDVLYYRLNTVCVDLGL
jgi:transcriptional regulator of acetoin/glycerol metabolism